MKFDGKEVFVMRELLCMVVEIVIGKEVDVVVLCKGDEVSIWVILE